VFLAPPRGVLTAATYEEAGRLHRQLTGGLGLSVQTWHLVPKIREVDAVADDPRLVEVHPELSLAALGGAGPLPSKKTAAGRAARVSLLTGWLGDLGELPSGDDGLDALAVAWSAQRWLAGRASALPGVPAYDEIGRPMRIVT
jgi:predicted RNase H-like nuclease